MKIRSFITGFGFAAALSVASAAHEHKLAELLTDAGATATWLSAAPAFDDVKNSYRDPAQLGVDRWMALIAARYLKPRQL